MEERLGVDDASDGLEGRHSRHGGRRWQTGGKAGDAS